MSNYNKNVELYVNEMDEVGVLYSPGFGAGWSTWNSDCYAYDKRIVEKFIEDPDMFHITDKIRCQDLKTFMTNLGYDGYYGGADDLRLTFIPRGTMFRITEYDGAEDVEIFDTSHYICF